MPTEHESHVRPGNTYVRKSSEERLPSQKDDRSHYIKNGSVRRSQNAYHTHHTKHPATAALPRLSAVQGSTQISRPTSAEREELEYCRKLALNDVRKCTNVVLLRLFIVISCLLHSQQALHRAQIVTILALLTRTDCEEEWDQEVGEEAILLQLEVECGNILLVEDSGHFSFAHPALGTLFRRVTIRGLDNTERTIAKACLESVHRFVSGQAIEEATGTSFLTYARSHWVTHYRNVQHNNIGFNWKVHQILMAGQGTSQVSELSQEQLMSILRFCQSSRLKVMERFYMQANHPHRVQFGQRDRSERDKEDSLVVQLESVNLGDSGYGSCFVWKNDMFHRT